MRPAAHPRGERAARRASLIIAVAALALLVPSIAVAASVCEAKLSPPYGTSYGSINVPSAPATHNAYYSFWSSPSPYYARRRLADGTIQYESLRSNGGDWDFANCFGGTCTDVERRTELKNANGASGWSYWVEAWNTTSHC